MNKILSSSGVNANVKNTEVGKGRLQDKRRDVISARKRYSAVQGPHEVTKKTNSDDDDDNNDCSFERVCCTRQNRLLPRSKISEVHRNRIIHHYSTRRKCHFLRSHLMIKSSNYDIKLRYFFYIKYKAGNKIKQSH